MSKDPQIINEIAPFTQEQWERIMLWGRIRYGEQATPAIQAARDFSQSIQEIQHMAGASHADIGGISADILKMAELPEQGA